METAFGALNVLYVRQVKHVWYIGKHKIAGFYLNCVQRGGGGEKWGTEGFVRKACGNGRIDRSGRKSIRYLFTDRCSKAATWPGGAAAGGGSPGLRAGLGAAASTSAPLSS